MHGTLDPETRRFRDDVLAGLAAPTPAIPARWFYDRRGSELFDAITCLPEYYLTRTETGLLSALAPEIAGLVPDRAAVIEFGAGSAAKTPIILQATAPSAYVPVDVSGDYLQASAATIAERFRDIAVHPVTADFTGRFTLPPWVDSHAKLGFFPGSTIGNFVPTSATDLLRHFRKLLGSGSQLLIGFDRIKDVRRLVAAYDDAQGVTARFNLNLLDRINRELGADVPVDAFRHEARWNEVHARIEMHLVAIRDVAFSICGRAFRFPEGRSIHTENSHKYCRRSARLLLLAGGWSPVREWADEAGDFLVILASAEPERFAP